MSAALALAPTTDVLSVADRYVPGTALTAEQAALLTAEIGSTLVRAQDMLRVAFQGKAHEVLGHGKGQAGWDSYFATYFAGLVHALPTAQRQLEVAKWNEVGASVRVTATALGSSVGTVSGDRKVVGQPENVISLDGRQRDAQAASTASAKPVRVKPTTVRALDSLHAAGVSGLTSAELGRRLRLHHGQASATLTRLEQQRRVFRNGDRRDSHSVYFHPEHLVLEAELVD